MLETITTKIQYNAVVILSYFFICLVILILDKLVQGRLVNNLFSTGRNDSLLNPLTYFKLISHSLGHSSWDHLYNNFLKILLIGPLIEEKYGSLNLLIMIILTSLIIGIINRIFSKNRILGASGIAYMLIVLCSFVNIESGKIPITVVLIILFFVVDEIINLLKRKKDGISHLGHVTGAICGILLGILSMNGINIIK
ncbi:MAG: rhomboid family intramembrane serine protease [bacterium]|nr:rhomboid family intramembrane serine protease [Mycoplasmatota bacterium]MDD6757065.1 rhomboid family intramembrane serine protease [bacterium]